MDTEMKSWRAAFRDSIVPGAIAALTTCATVAARGRRDSGNAVAPINAATHAFWGDDAARVGNVTLRHTLPGVLINVGASLWWALICQKLFGKAVQRYGAPAAMLAGAATSGIAYITDYKLLPRRLSPGWELRLTNRSLALSLGAMAVGLALGSVLMRRGD
jgi:hypothetical protein